MDLHSFSKLLEEVDSTDNFTRTQALEAVSSLDPAFILNSLCSIIDGSQFSEKLQKKAADEFAVSGRNIFLKVVASSDRRALLRRFFTQFEKFENTEKGESVAIGLGSLVESGFLTYSQWREFYDCLLRNTICDGNENGEKESGANPKKDATAISACRRSCLAAMKEAVLVILHPGGFPQNILARFPAALEQCFNDADISVRKWAVVVICHFLIILTGNNQISSGIGQSFNKLVSKMLNMISATAKEHPRSEDVASMCGGCGTLVEASPISCKGLPAGKLFVETLLGIMKNSDSSREVLTTAGVSIVRYFEALPKTGAKMKDHLKEICELFVQMLQCLPKEQDREAWEEDIADDRFAKEVLQEDLAGEGLDRLATAMGGDVIAPIVAPVLMQKLAAPDSASRIAAVIALMSIAEGCKDNMAPFLQTILGSLLMFINDADPYLRVYSLRCIAQFMKDFSPVVQEQLHSAVLPALLGVLRKDEIPKIHCYAATAIHAFFDCVGDNDEEDRSEMFSAYYTDILQVLSERLGTPFLAARSMFYVAIGSVVDTAKQCISEIDFFMTPIIAELANEQRKSWTLVNDAQKIKTRCRAIEAATLLASAIGKKKFAKYSELVCQCLSEELSEDYVLEDPRKLYALRGWRCMVSCLQDDAIPFLGQLFPPLLKICKTELPAYSIGVAPPPGEEFHVVTDYSGDTPKEYNLLASHINARGVAAIILESLVHELPFDKKEQYIPDVLDVACQLLFVAYSNEAVEAACLMMGAVAAHYKRWKTAAEHTSFIQTYYSVLLNGALAAPDIDISTVILDILSTMIADGPDDAIAATEASVIVGHVPRLLAVVLANEEEDEDEDSGDGNSVIYLHCCSELCTVCFKKSNDFCTSFSSSIASLMVILGMPNSFKRIAILEIFCNFLECGRGNALAVLSQLALVFGQSAVIEAHQLVHQIMQATFYGLGLISTAYCQNFNDSLKEEASKFAQQTHELLVHYLKRNANADRGDEDQWGQIANAMSTALILLENWDGGGLFDSRALLAPVIDLLPAMGADEIEARRLHSRLMFWIENEHPLLSGDDDLRDVIIAKLQKAKRTHLDVETFEKLRELS